MFEGLATALLITPTASEPLRVESMAPQTVGRAENNTKI